LHVFFCAFAALREIFLAAPADANGESHAKPQRPQRREDANGTNHMVALYKSKNVIEFFACMFCAFAALREI